MERTTLSSGMVVFSISAVYYGSLDVLWCVEWSSFLFPSVRYVMLVLLVFVEWSSFTWVMLSNRNFC
jgi:hypothetical protein